MCARTFQMLVAFSVALISIPTRTSTAQGLGSPSTRALQFFRTLPTGDVGAALAGLRPPPLRVEDRVRVLASLPLEGELHPDAREVIKLAGIEPILRYHDRVDVVAIKLIDVPQAFIGLHARSVLLVSRPALAMLSAAELQAFIAHEIGHELFWNEYERAGGRRDTRALQEIELKCDGIAVLTLMALSLDVTMLDSGMRKLTRFNETLGTTVNADAYPNLDVRARFVRDVAALRAARSTLLPW
jgi:hypothetical protein